jgi:hypothetical protein
MTNRALANDYGSGSYSGLCIESDISRFFEQAKSIDPASLSANVIGKIRDLEDAAPDFITILISQYRAHGHAIISR